MHRWQAIRPRCHNRAERLGRFASADGWMDSSRHEARRVPLRRNGGDGMFPLTADLVEAYSALFIHSWETYAVQQGDGSYWCAHESLFPARLVDHLLGRYTLGTY